MTRAERLHKQLLEANQQGYARERLLLLLSFQDHADLMAEFGEPPKGREFLLGLGVEYELHGAKIPMGIYHKGIRGRALHALAYLSAPLDLYQPWGKA